MPEFIDEAVLDKIAEAIAADGYLVLDGVLPVKCTGSLRARVDQLSTEFAAAGIGRNNQFQISETIRSDKIHWLDHHDAISAEYLDYMEQLRLGMNRRLFLGLADYEGHFAYYAAGTFYKKHLDTFHLASPSKEHVVRAKTPMAQPVRVLSTVFYLNEGWQESSGGELVIYAESESHSEEKIVEKIMPQSGRLVIFLSKKFPHEVLPANRERKSIAGWFRTK